MGTIFSIDPRKRRKDERKERETNLEMQKSQKKNVSTQKKKKTQRKTGKGARLELHWKGKHYIDWALSWTILL